MEYKEYNTEIENLIKRIEAGENPHLSHEMKNVINMKMAARIIPNDMVEVIATGEIGRVTKYVRYNREHQDVHSPCGYIAIQVNINGVYKTYAGRSLRVIKQS